MLFEVMWNTDAITKAFVEEKRLTQSFVNRWRSVLEEAVKRFKLEKRGYIC